MNLKLESYNNVNFVKVVHIKYSNRDQMFQHKQLLFSNLWSRTSQENTFKFRRNEMWDFLMLTGALYLGLLKETPEELLKWPNLVKLSQVFGRGKNLAVGYYFIEFSQLLLYILQPIAILTILATL